MVCDVDIPHIGTYIFPLLLNVCLIIILVMYVERGLYIYYFGGNLLVRQVISLFHLWQDAIFCTFFPLILSGFPLLLLLLTAHYGIVLWVG